MKTPFLTLVSTFATTRHICVTQCSFQERHICMTLLITHICVQVDYQLFVHQLLLITHICATYYIKERQEKHGS